MVVFEAIKIAAETLRKAGNIELYQQILDSYEKAIEIMGENIELKEQVRKLKERLEIEDSLVFENHS